MLRSAPPKNYNRGRLRFQIPPPLLRVSPGRCSLVCLNSLHPWIQRIVGLPPFLALREAHRLMNHSPHSMDSRLSSIIRSLRLTFDTVSRAQLPNLIYSLPLLAGLSIVARSVDVDQGSSSIQLSRSPVFTGSLKLSLSTGIGLIASELLSLPSGFHFRRLDLEWNRDEDIPSTVALVESCCHTLEDLRVRPNSELFEPLAQPMDLSKATGHKRVVLACRSADPKWITVTLRSITDDHKHLQQIILDASCMFDILDILWPDRVTPAEVRLEIGKPAYREWIKLDRSLSRLLEHAPSN